MFKYKLKLPHGSYINMNIKINRVNINKFYELKFIKNSGQNMMTVFNGLQGDDMWDRNFEGRITRFNFDQHS